MTRVLLAAVCLAALHWAATATHADPPAKRQSLAEIGVRVVDLGSKGTKVVLEDGTSFTFTGHVVEEAKPGICCWPTIVEFTVAQSPIWKEHAKPVTIDLQLAIDQLRSPNYVVREAATERLAQLNTLVKPQLTELATHDDPEVRSRARHLLTRLEPPKLEPAKEEDPTEAQIQEILELAEFLW